MLGNIFNTFANCFKIPELKSRMEYVLKKEDIQGVPLVAEVKVGKNWDDMEPYKV